MTAADLLHEQAAKGARALSSPAQTTQLNAAIKRTLDDGRDGQVQALKTPDGRLLALKIISTHKNQSRSVLIPRGPEVEQMPANLSLEHGTYRTRSRVGLRRAPYEGPPTHSLELGELLESIGTVGSSGWRLVARNGRALGYLKANELQKTNTPSTYPTRISDPESTVFDVAKVNTTCRNVQYAIDGGGSAGSFKACRAYGGEWVLEQNGDTPALSPGRYVFKR